MKLWNQMRVLMRRGAMSRRSEKQLVPSAPDATAAGRLVVVAEGPLPLAEMYADVLRGQGLPAVLRSAGAGRGALGGAGVQVDVLVAAAALDQARDILGIDETGAKADQSERDERKDGNAR